MPEIDISTQALLERIRRAIDRQRAVQEKAKQAGEEVQQHKEQGTQQPK